MLIWFRDVWKFNRTEFNKHIDVWNRSRLKEVLLVQKNELLGIVVTWLIPNGMDDIVSYKSVSLHILFFVRGFFGFFMRPILGYRAILCLT